MLGSQFKILDNTTKGANNINQIRMNHRQQQIEDLEDDHCGHWKLLPNDRNYDKYK